MRNGTESKNKSFSLVFKDVPQDMERDSGFRESELHD